MGEQWYYILGGNKVGPLSGAEVKQLAASAQLSPADMVWKAGMTNWVPAETIKGLFTATRAATATLAQPSAPGGREPQSTLTNNANPLKTPAITLIVAGAITALVALAAILMVLTERNMFSGPDAAIQKAFSIFYLLLLLALSGVVMFGGTAMLKHAGFGLSMAGVISGVVLGVLSGPLGWLLVLPVGIWALIILRKPEAKRVFSKGAKR